MHESRKGGIVAPVNEEQRPLAGMAVSGGGNKMSNRTWAEILRFYLRVALFGDPVERRPKVRALQPVMSTQLTELRPLAHTK
jgi:hypothetical protein